MDVNDCSLAHLTLILLLHYLVKSRSGPFWYRPLGFKSDPDLSKL